MAVTRTINDETMNKVLQKVKYVPGSKMFVGDINKITGCSSKVVISAFNEVGKTVNMCKMVKNGECYGALMNLEPIEADDYQYTVKPDPKKKRNPKDVEKESELYITPLHESECGEMELMAFKIVAHGYYVKDVREPEEKQYDEDGNEILSRKHRGSRGSWFTVQDLFSRRFVTVMPQIWNNKGNKVQFDISCPDTVYYGRVKVSQNKTRIDPGLLYLNVYEAGPYHSHYAEEIQEKFFKKYMMIDK